MVFLVRAFSSGTTSNHTRYVKMLIAFTRPAEFQFFLYELAEGQRQPSQFRRQPRNYSSKWQRDLKGAEVRRAKTKKRREEERNVGDGGERGRKRRQEEREGAFQLLWL